MQEAFVSIREMRLDFRSVKRKMEEHGSVVVTDRGKPMYRLNRIEPVEARPRKLPDYYARLQNQRAMSAGETRELHEENRS